ncbi:MAG TPA: orotidine-5'-phosphate decarboxylase [Bacteroidales bacterium]|jgi:orotidine-5'-phosphate decarboxylase|nr:orotidine-5'-phosphate decarboxylase [Bacteroidales bacterium]OPZ55564.1 MAG: orotidine 5'-phosphate decarboxylase [Bacteroidetes bacterium ADurb.BinA012]HNV65839.1 orotidine-5'-phosphate decarboxylase [Bacteroidales bacterium]HNY57406.1 orotidine-5'-phosphate decarboxylase [Bacteroidales bacterium]HOH15587.1 orotidine-5'-phosphate decarboxylase [Bacteroidales bacterium]
MTARELFQHILKKKSFLCVGLDPEISKLPACLAELEEPIFEFNRQIIDATHRYAVAYKPNFAFYESYGARGMAALDKTVRYINKLDTNIFIIADAKRGDIGNTSKMYARAVFGEMPFDAVTVAPYMGEDSVTPFLSYGGKWAIILALTSNRGADDFQYHTDKGQRLFERVLTLSQRWGTTDNLMYVVGATRAEMLADIRKIVPDHFLLVPGVGAQGGSLEEVARYGMNNQCGLLVNSSRGIIYADSSDNFADVAGEKAREMQEEMALYLADRFKI